MRALPCVLMLCSLAGVARADYSKAWTAAKASLPRTTRAIALLDLQLFDNTPYFERLLKKGLETDVAGFDRDLKQLCKVDAARTIEGAVVAANPAKGTLVMFVQLGIDRGKASACFEALLSKMAGEKVKLEQEGIYTVLASKNGRNAYFAWPAPNVLALTFEPDNKPALAMWLDGKGEFEKSPVAPLLAKTVPKAVVAGAFDFGQPLWNMPFSSGYGEIVRGGSNLTAHVVAITPNTAVASKIAAEADKELGQLKAKPSLPAPTRSLLARIAIVAKGPNIHLEATATLKELVELMESEIRPSKREKP